MVRSGQSFEVILKEAHIGWGTHGNSRTGTNSRNEFETYLPISLSVARDLNILTGEIFSCVSSDGYFEGDLKASGSQGISNQFAKNLSKNGDLRALGYWLKDRIKANPGDRVRIEFTDENSVVISHFPS